jgi:hypothetical protein
MRSTRFMVTALFLAACGAEGTRPTEASSADVQTGPPPEDSVDAGSGITWTDLYRDLFGPSGQASCAGDGGCHGAAESSGSVPSGFVCASKGDCRASILSADSSLVLPGDSSAPARSQLVATLRRRSATGGIIGLMPKSPAYVFSHDSINRIEAWIRNGAPDD